MQDEWETLVGWLYVFDELEIIVYVWEWQKINK